MMDAPSSRITAKLGIPVALAEKTVGMILGYVQRAGDDGAMARTLTQIPGAAEMVAHHAGEEAGDDDDAGGGQDGSLLGRAMGALSSITGGEDGGGLMAIGQELSAEGLEVGQIKEIARETFAYAKEQADPEPSEHVKASVPGLSAFA